MSRLGKSSRYAATLLFLFSILGGFTLGISNATSAQAAGGRGLTTNITANDSCHAYKANTGNESESGGKNRLEVGGAQPQMIDFYPADGVQAVSYILDVQTEVRIWWGYGSIWEFPGCTLNFVRSQTRGYITGEDRSIARLDNGHSGVVFDMTTGEITNYGSLDGGDGNVGEEIAALLEVHKMGLQGKMDTNKDGLGEGTGQPTECASTETAYGGIAGCMPASMANSVDTGNLLTKEDQGGSGGTTNCSGTDGTKHDPINGVVWDFTTTVPVTFDQFWTNWEDMDQGAHKVYLDPGTYQLKGGGMPTNWPAGCEQEAQDSLGPNYMTIDDLKDADLAA